MVHSFLNCHSSGGSEAGRSASLWGLLFPGTTLTLSVWFCGLTFYVTVLTQRRMWGILCHMSSQMRKLHKASSLACFDPEYSHDTSPSYHSLSWGDHSPVLVSVSITGSKTVTTKHESRQRQISNLKKKLDADFIHCVWMWPDLRLKSSTVDISTQLFKMATGDLCLLYQAHFWISLSSCRKKILFGFQVEWTKLVQLIF